MVKRVLKSYDYLLIAAPILLSLFGVVMVYSASMVWAVMMHGGTTDLFYSRQLMWFYVSLLAFIVAAILPYRLYKRLVKFIFIVSILLLVVVLVAGSVSNNASSWLYIGGFGFQPAEFIKLGLIIYLAAVFSKKQSYIDQFFPAFGPPLMFIAIIFGLIFIQPDLGTGGIILLISYVMIACSGIRFKHLATLTGAGVLGILILIPFLSDEQLSRFGSAYHPFADLKGDGYQLINSYVAIASGGVSGNGLGESIQKFGYLPEPHTDFIMAVISEELGIFGVAFVLLTLLFIILRGLKYARYTSDPFASLLAIGICSMFGIQAIVNIGAMIGLLPITGVTLPFISYGGSSLLLLMYAAGILVNISMHTNLRHRVKKQKNIEFTT
ncbi:FtsW/RodA/SpoVE family cell cycle protein [Bacillus tianshenii]|nr:FtsW/RodA/SpoVE family cell cycle protein [Bacillus tianshenii]